ncbi:hypothetical protein ACFOQM_18405 [Paenibacillus sp. GCM10012307]|nr:hypothetical protein [Paenibacillus roseus]
MSKELEELEIIEARELEVGNAFHAFRFSVASQEDISDKEE